MTLHVVGLIPKSIQIEGEPTAYGDGWHVNSTEELADKVAFQCFPAMPYNVFAGVDTYFYRFASEEEANTELGLGE